MTSTDETPSRGPAIQPGTRPLFITLEGGEGSGKSTLACGLKLRLMLAGLPVVTTREPGGSPIGSALRAILLDPSGEPIGPRTEALLFAAERAHHADTLIRPALASGTSVLCDRYLDSSIAYQGVARGLGADRIRDLSVWATGALVPDMTLLLDVDPVVGLSRRGAAGGVDRLDGEAVEFHQQVRAAFLGLAGAEPDRFVVLDADGDPADLLEQAVAAVLTRAATGPRTG